MHVTFKCSKSIVSYKFWFSSSPSSLLPFFPLPPSFSPFLTFCLKVISTKAVLSSSGLAGMYTDVLNLLPKRCSLLLELTHPQPSGLAPRVPGFDFVTNAVWPEVVALIDERVSIIFAPGNPDNFYKVTSLVQLMGTFTFISPPASHFPSLSRFPSFTSFLPLSIFILLFLPCLPPPCFSPPHSHLLPSFLPLTPFVSYPSSPSPLHIHSLSLSHHSSLDLSSSSYRTTQPAWILWHHLRLSVPPRLA